MLPYLRYVVSAGLIAALFKFVDARQTWAVLRTASMPLIAAAALTYLAAFPVMAYRWRLLLEIQNVGISYTALIRYYLIGFFFNNFLPTSIGGDVVRVYTSARTSGKRPECLAAVMIERIIGLLAIIALAVAGTWYAAGRLQNGMLVWVSAGLGGAVTAGLLFLLNERCLGMLVRLTANVTRFGIGRRVGGLCSVFMLFRGKWTVFAKVFAASVAYQCVMVVFTYLLNLAMGLGVAFTDFFVCVPAVAILGLLPSVNGLGVREGGFVYLLTALGTAAGGVVGKPSALSFSLLVLMVGMAVSLLGGLVFALDKGAGRDGLAEALHKKKNV